RRRVGENRAAGRVDVALDLVVGDDALGGGGLVVPYDQLDLAAEQAAVRVALLDGEFDGLLVLAAERGVVAGEGDDEAHPDRVLLARAATAAAAARVAAACGQRHRETCQDREQLAHQVLLVGVARM